MKSVYAYTFRDLRGDYARAAVGFAICAIPFFYGFPAPLFLVFILAMAAIFAWLFWQTLSRHLASVVVDDNGIEVSSLWKKAIAWGNLEAFNLAYYSTWRNKTKGWMELRLKGRGATIRIASSMTGFRDVVRIAAAAAGRNRLEFNEATIENLRSMDIPDPRNYG